MLMITADRETGDRVLRTEITSHVNFFVGHFQVCRVHGIGVSPSADAPVSPSENDAATQAFENRVFNRAMKRSLHRIHCPSPLIMARTKSTGSEVFSAAIGFGTEHADTFRPAE